MTKTHTISMAASKYTWEDVDKRATELGFNRSKYIQKLAERDITQNILEKYSQFLSWLLMLTILGACIIILGILLV